MPPLRLILSVLYAAVGTSAFVAFLILQYYAGAVFAFVTAALSAMTAHINWLHQRHRLNLWYDFREMSQFYWLGLAVFALCFSGFVYFLVAYVVLQEYAARVDLLIGCIWGLIAGKAAAVLMYFTHRYTREGIEMNLIVNGASG